MSKSDMVRLPKITAYTLTESDEMGDYTFSVVNDRKRRDVVNDREQKREQAQARTMHKRDLDDLDYAEQMRDALFTPAYEGPVGTKVAEWERVLLHDNTQADNLSLMLGSHEVRMSDCTYGCKVYRSGDGREFIHHSSVYGHAEASIEPVAVKVQHVVPKRERMNAPKRRVGNDGERENYRLEREMRELGFGARYGIHL